MIMSVRMHPGRERKLSASYPNQPKYHTKRQVFAKPATKAKRASREANPLQFNSDVLVLQQLPRRDSNPRPGD